MATEKYDKHILAAFSIAWDRPLPKIDPPFSPKQLQSVFTRSHPKKRASKFCLHLARTRRNQHGTLGLWILGRHQKLISISPPALRLFN